jgi:hypothetical protein
MLSLHHWMRRSCQALGFLGVVCGSCLPARAEFFPDKGVAVSHWKEPKEGWGFGGSYWLSDHELVYVQHGPYYLQRYVKRDFTTGEDQVLEGFTKLVDGTVGTTQLIPSHIAPSPDGKYLAWIATDNAGSETLIVATKDGSIVSKQLHAPHIYYLNWSEDSQWCFGFLEGQVHDDPLPGNHRKVFNAIAGISIKTPSVVKTYPIVLKPDSTRNALSGYLEFRVYVNLQVGPKLSLPVFHFGSNNNILLMSTVQEADTNDVQFDEYNLADTTMPVRTYTKNLPVPWPLVEFGVISNAIISPQGDAIVWTLRHGNDIELWLSDKNCGHTQRIGKFYKGEAQSPPRIFNLNLGPEMIKWLPSGKGISFREAGELYVVYLNAPVIPH